MSMEFYFWRVKKKSHYSKMNCNFADIVDFVVSALFTASIKSDKRNLCKLFASNNEIQNIK